MTGNPYSDSPDAAFWRQGVAQTSPLDMPDIYTPKWAMEPDWAIATAGSCFAQHIARNLRQSGYNVIDAERAPNGLAPARRNAFGYALYSARFGNIYTARQLRQLFEEALGDAPPSAHIWERDGRYFDALRPNVEPQGLATRAEIEAHRAWHLERVREMMQSTDFFVFTLGLTEAWVHKASGTVFPTAPGVIAGTFDAEDYAFQNFGFNEIVEDLTEALRLLARARGGPVRTMLTVSPVPLTATAENRHVLLSSTYSKAVLRAVAGHLADQNPEIDYFPSYEIVTNPAARGVFYASNLRSVTPEGVDIVMRHFFAVHPRLGKSAPSPAANNNDDLICEEALLEAFGE